MREIRNVQSTVGGSVPVGAREGAEELLGVVDPLDDEGGGGGNAMGWCRICKANGEHTIITEADEADEDDDDAVQVGLCTDCGDEHPMEAPRKTRKRGASRAAKQKRDALVTSADLATPEAILAAWRRLVKDADEESALAYSPSLSLTLSDVVRHPRFGLGVVFAAHSPTKVGVLFADKQRLLVCNR